MLLKTANFKYAVIPDNVRRCLTVQKTVWCN